MRFYCATLKMSWGITVFICKNLTNWGDIAMKSNEFEKIAEAFEICKNSDLAMQDATKLMVNARQAFVQQNKVQDAEGMMERAKNLFAVAKEYYQKAGDILDKPGCVGFKETSLHAAKMEKFAEQALQEILSEDKKGAALTRIGVALIEVGLAPAAKMTSEPTSFQPK
jgi:hypothetical protein